MSSHEGIVGGVAAPVRVLLVEDNEYDQIAFNRMVKQRELNYEVQTAATGAEGLSQLQEGACDIVVLDFLLIDMDGLEFLKAMREREIDTPVIFLTGQGSEKVAVAAMKLGAYDYLTKTSDMSHLAQLPSTITQAIDQYKLRKEREDIERMRSDFIAMLTHDLKNPLATIISAAEFLSEADSFDERQSRMVTLIESASKDMLDLVENFLMVSKIEAGRLEQTREPVNINEVLTRVYNMNKLLAENKGVSFKIDLAQDLPAIKCNPTQMFRVFSNLVGNALKFTPKGKEVEISSEGDSGQIRIYVKDQGAGIAPDLLPYIFDKYKRSAGDANPKGIGLGLYIVKMIVESLDGQVQVSSQLGKGTTFTIFLPAN
ncbi:response regulator [candidate division WOR-3 bacterium]|uniref:histidine kinase n=1 Tax=candidate division WOR-3 bacterium TaxID=2052148 RepID=A0A9D5K8Y1_UNCW3|nr:response regulator [candidate division WOR-3 bacterium]MBD3363805.1 response regulator [candidate division WOR-3 bacterium]